MPREFMKKCNPNRKWKNKENGNIVKVRPYWEIPDPDEDMSYMVYEGVNQGLPEGQKVATRYGIMYHGGWLFWNGEVWFVLPLSVESQFEDLGVWEDEKGEKEKCQTQTS